MKRNTTVRGLGTTKATGQLITITNSCDAILVIIEIMDDGSGFKVKHTFFPYEETKDNVRE